MQYLKETNLELSKQDNQMAKRLAILAMVALHLFCRLGNLPYIPLIYIGNTPIIYYFGLFGDICVPIYCFCSGYAQYLLREQEEMQYFFKMRKRLFGFIRHFWIILIIFSILGVFYDREGGIPGGFWKFIGNLTLIDLNYNGAWWFVLTYVFMTLLSPVLYRVVKKCPWILTGSIFCIIYMASYIFRFNYSVTFHNVFFKWLWKQSLLLGTSLFPYIIGMIVRRYHLITILRTKLSTIKSSVKDLVLCMTVIVLFLLHCIFQTLSIAPLTGLGTLICFYLWNKTKPVKKFFEFFGKHSTNIWLTHMFFYMVLFPGLVFKAKFPVIIYLTMLLLCVGVSYIINYFEKFICINWRKVYAIFKHNSTCV